ncbi:two-component system, OmpR family, phosphate regulon sensor histidine kinase PhoR [Ekhidna lutea]|uniref:histidine kinase n=1 Tax=Ekhidna lutea TaxID=447679 RepID=A0A239IZE0_EKHLU|nr:ATP-binding protein [Ekhidna lutea]SNS98929.1 two-component system, OmpR family, phosphate regulon sensor histidine kinase PhoR [Ekhidna lutea]
MQFNSRAIALLLALCVAVITTAFLYLLPNITTTAIVIAFLLSFSSSYILVRLVLEFLFFRQIETIYDSLKKIRDSELALKGRMSSVNPLKRINREISSFAKSKEKEIEELKERENFRREFIADVSHELKTPIFAAQGFVHTLLDGAINDKEVRKKFLKKAAKSLDALDLLVADILTISQIESGEIKMHFENFDMRGMCAEIIDQLDGKSEKKGVELKMSKKYKDPIIVRGDYRRIYQVMLNLISNAIKYTKNGGQAKISFKEIEDSKIRIMVTDNGRGIPESDISRIFERFYRVDKSRSREKGGTGLGLSIVKHILESHDSEIFVESEYKIGSTFYFDLNKANYIDKVDEGWEEEEDYA